MATKKADVEVSGIGESVLRFTGLTKAGKRALADDLGSESWQWLGNSLVIDHRMAGGAIDHLTTYSGVRVRVL